MQIFLSLPTEEVDSTTRSLKMNRCRSSQMVGFIINKKICGCPYSQLISQEDKYESIHWTMQFNMYLLYKIVLINFVFWITAHHKEVLAMSTNHNLDEVVERAAKLQLVHIVSNMQHLICVDKYNMYVRRLM